MKRRRFINITILLILILACRQNNSKKSSNMSIPQIIEQYHQALDEFSRGNAQPVKMLYSHIDDVMLANPFGNIAVGWPKVSDAIDHAVSQFREGEAKNYIQHTKFISPEILIIFETEKWKAKMGGKSELSSFDLRVSSTFRFENGQWKLVHRHADPIMRLNPAGPLRKDM